MSSPAKSWLRMWSIWTSATTALGKDVAIKLDMGKVYVNDAEIIITDIETSNGVIHVIDTVLLPPARADKKTSSTPQSLTAASPPWSPPSKLPDWSKP